MKKDIDDYLQEGLTGPVEVKPDERRRYLGTLRERVLVSLTQSQVREPGTYNEIETHLKQNPGVKMLLNGNMAYPSLSDYMKLAERYSIPYSLTVNQEYNSELGLVLTFNYAIDREDIAVPKSPTKQKTTNKGSFFKRIKKFF